MIIGATVVTQCDTYVQRCPNVDREPDQKNWSVDIKKQCMEIIVDLMALLTMIGFRYDKNH